MFGLDLGNLLVHLKADTKQFTASMAAAKVNAAKTGKAIQLGLGIGLGAAALGIGITTKAFASFDQAMTQSVAIMGDVTTRMRKGMEQLAISMSRKGIQSASQLAESYYFLASAGLNVEQSMAALPVVQSFATAGMFDMAEATDLLTDAQSALGLTVDDTKQNMLNMTRVGDVLVKANTLANASVEQFSRALTSEAGAAMKAYNVDLEEGVAVLATYADQGIKAQHAGSMFSRMLRLMTKGFQDNKGMWDHFGISIYDATGELKGLDTIVGDLSGVLVGMSTEQKVATLAMLGFQARSQQAILPLLGMQDAIKGYEDELKTAGGTMDDVSQRQLASFTNQMKMMWNSIKAVGIMFGRIFAQMGPGLKNFFDDVSSFLIDNEQMWVDWGNAVKSVVGGVVDIAKAAAGTLEDALRPGIIHQQALERYRTETGDVKAGTLEFRSGGTFGGGMVPIEAKNKKRLKEIENQLKREQRVVDQTKELRAKFSTNMRKHGGGAVTPLEIVTGAYDEGDGGPKMQTIPEYNNTDLNVFIEGYETAKTAIEKYEEQLEKEMEIIGKLNESHARSADLLAYENQLRIVYAGRQDIINQKMAEMRDKLLELRDQERLVEIADGVGDSFARAFEDITMGARDATEAIKAFGMEVLRLTMRQTITGPLSKALSSGIQGFLTPTPDVTPSLATGTLSELREASAVYDNAPSLAELRRDAGLAKGGVLSGATLFNSEEGMGMAGEAGPEAFVPLKRMTDGNLGVASSGGGGLSVVVNNQTNTPIETSDISFDADNMVADIIIRDRRNGGPISQGHMM